MIIQLHAYSNCHVVKVAYTFLSRVIVLFALLPKEIVPSGITPALLRYEHHGLLSGSGENLPGCGDYGVGGTLGFVPKRSL